MSHTRAVAGLQSGWSSSHLAVYFLLLPAGPSIRCRSAPAGRALAVSFVQRPAHWQLVTCPVCECSGECFDNFQASASRHCAYACHCELSLFSTDWVSLNFRIFSYTHDLDKYVFFTFHCCSPCSVPCYKMDLSIRIPHVCPSILGRISPERKFL